MIRALAFGEIQGINVKAKSHSRSVALAEDAHYASEAAFHLLQELGIPDADEVVDADAKAGGCFLGF